MSTTPNVPEPKEAYHYETSTPRWILVALVILLVLAGYAIYSGYTTRTDLEKQLGQMSDANKRLTAQVDQANSRIADLKGAVEVTTQKLGFTQAELAQARSLAQKIRQEQKVSDEKLTAQIGQVKQESESKIGQVSTELGGAKTDIETTKKDLEATKGKLDRAMGDLGVQSGLIARNREDLEELKRRGERNYFDFDLRRTKDPQRIGPIQVRLLRVDTKRNRYTMTVFADDKAIEKKDKTVAEPVQFYVKGARIPFEIVVFEVGKDRATGYLATPKEAGAAKPQS